MLSLKVTVRLIAMMMLLSIGFVLYPQGSANAAKFCAELRGATPTGNPDCSFPVASRVSRARQGWGRRTLLQIAPLGRSGEVAI